MKTWLDEILHEALQEESVLQSLSHKMDCECETCKGKRKYDAFSSHKGFRERKKERSSPSVRRNKPKY